MKIHLIFMNAILLVLFSIGMAAAATYTFNPVGDDLSDLNHDSYYTWGIEWTIPVGERIVGASLTFYDIRNWDDSSNELWVHLLDDATLGVASGADNQGAGDYFSGQDILLTYWENLSSTAQDITYIFDLPTFGNEVATLTAYLANNGIFGLGFDPDCHFYNEGVSLSIETERTYVPIPSTFWLFTTGLVFLVGIRRNWKVRTNHRLAR